MAVGGRVGHICLARLTGKSPAVKAGREISFRVRPLNEQMHPMGGLRIEQDAVSRQATLTRVASW